MKLFLLLGLISTCYIYSMDTQNTSTENIEKTSLMKSLSDTEKENIRQKINALTSIETDDFDKKELVKTIKALINTLNRKSKLKNLCPESKVWLIVKRDILKSTLKVLQETKI